jgi:hypothetical protein
VAQVVQHLPNKHEGLSSNSRTAKKKRERKERNLNISTQKTVMQEMRDKKQYDI